MKVFFEHVSAETNARGSRFLAEAFPVETQESARAALKAQKAKYADATHVVHAFAIGPAAGILGCSDDGEPSGTAGRPVLEVVKGSGLTNVMVTVARWFGGTLLGTGGLVKAYTEAAHSCVDLALENARELEATRDFSVVVPYDAYERVRREIDSIGATVSEERFAEDVSVCGTVRLCAVEAFSARVSDLTQGRSTVTLSPESQTARIT